MEKNGETMWKMTGPANQGPYIDISQPAATLSDQTRQQQRRNRLVGARRGGLPTKFGR